MLPPRAATSGADGSAPRGNLWYSFVGSLRRAQLLDILAAEPCGNLAVSTVVSDLGDQGTNEGFLFPGGELVPQWIELLECAGDVSRVSRRRVRRTIMLQPPQ